MARGCSRSGTPYVADRYALLIGPPPPAEASVPQQILDWPLDAPIGTFGTAVANDTRRCGAVTGDDAATLEPVLAAGEPGQPVGPGSVDERDVRGRGPAVRPRRGSMRGVVRAGLSRFRGRGA